MNGPPPSLQPNVSRLLRRAQRAQDDADFARAERLYNAVLAHAPESFDALHGLGRIHFRNGRLDTALTLFQTALQNDLDRPEAFASLGLVFYALARFAEALKSFEAGLRLAPDDAELLNRRGVALLELGRPQEALVSFDRVLEAQPDHLEALGNRGNTLLKLNRPLEALAAYDKALAIAPDNVQLLTNRAVALRRLDRPQEAVMSARRALVLKPDFAQAQFVESMARLTLGDFEAGWRGYEARWLVGFLVKARRSFTAPQWRGDSPLAGKTILLHAEQGLGDTLQFVRYAPLLAGRGAKVVLEVQAPLKRLLSAMPGVAAVLARGEALPDFDLHCPLLSLPLALATRPATIPADIPYVAPHAAEIAAFEARLPRRRPRIGVVWSGERTHDNDLNRSMRFATLAPLFDLPDIAFVGLQRDIRDEDAAAVRGCPAVRQIGPSFRDFADTAAAVAGLDAVISVDTAVAHLAGAMGKPLFLLLPFAADFRWLRERSDSPWYPSAQLLRQPKFGDWDSVVDALRWELTKTAALRPADKLSA